MNRSLPLKVEFDWSPCCRAELADWRVVRGYPLQRCSDCGSGYVNPRPTLKALKKYYRTGGHGERTASTAQEVLDAEERYPNSTVDARRILAVASELAPGGRLLDVGCGYGFFAREAKKQGFRVDALELSEFERRCTDEIADLQPEAVTFEEFRADPGSYDVILMSQILEHVAHPVEWIEKADRLLASEGLLALAFPNFNSLFRLFLGPGDPLVHPPDHLNYFNEQGLVELLSKASFTVVSRTTISRLPGSALTDRIPVPDGLKPIAEQLAQTVQRPLLRPLDELGLGMFLNVYAVKGSDA